MRNNIMVNQEYCLERTDSELVALALTKADYFACLIKRYEHQLVVYIKRISGLNHEDAEDILQEVFIKVFYNLNDFDSGLKFSSWIYRITHNETMSELRRRHSRPTVIIDDEEWESLACNTDLIKEINSQYDRALIEKIFNQLSEKYREVLLLRFVEDLDYRAISDILRLPINTVGTLVARARQKFKQEFIKTNPDRYDRAK